MNEPTPTKVWEKIKDLEGKKNGMIASLSKAENFNDFCQRKREIASLQTRLDKLYQELD